MDLTLILERSLLNSLSYQLQFQLLALLSTIFFKSGSNGEQRECTFPLCSSITVQHNNLYLHFRTILNINKTISMRWTPLGKQNISVRHYNLLLLKCYIRYSTGYVINKKKYNEEKFRMRKHLEFFITWYEQSVIFISHSGFMRHFVYWDRWSI